MNFELDVINTSIVLKDICEIFFGRLTIDSSILALRSGVSLCPCVCVKMVVSNNHDKKLGTNRNNYAAITFRYISKDSLSCFESASKSSSLQTTILSKMDAAILSPTPLSAPLAIFRIFLFYYVSSNALHFFNHHQPEFKSHFSTKN